MDEILLEYENARKTKSDLIKFIGKDENGNSIVEFVYPKITVLSVGKIEHIESGKEDGVLKIAVKMEDIVLMTIKRND